MATWPTERKRSALVIASPHPCHRYDKAKGDKPNRRPILQRRDDFFITGGMLYCNSNRLIMQVVDSNKATCCKKNNAPNFSDPRTLTAHLPGKQLTSATLALETLGGCRTLQRLPPSHASQVRWPHPCVWCFT